MARNGTEKTEGIQPASGRTLRRNVDVRLGAMSLRRRDITGKGKDGTGISATGLNRWEREGVVSMTVANLFRLAAELRVRPDVLMYETEAVPEELTTV